MKKFLLVCFTFVFALGVAWAQERTISGKVRSPEDGSALPGVNVVLKGTTNGTVTDTDGNYKMTVPGTGGTLVFSFIGFMTQEVGIGTQSTIDVQLEVDSKQLSEVVVTGYGTSQSKRDLTGSIASVSGKDIAAMPIQSFDQALQGRAAGVNVSTPNGVLNNPPVIRIRGVSSISLSSFPLVVVDGVPTYTGDISTTNSANNPLSNINPADIESVEVLKDASASAIYGSRASAGVILITTKRGTKGRSKVSLDSWVGVTQPFRLFNMMNADEYMMVKNEAVRNLNANRVALGLSPTNIEGFKPSYDAAGNQINTRWYDNVYQNGISFSNNLSFSGGTDNTSYYLSVGHTKQEGMVKKNTFERASIRLNLDQKIFDWLSVGTNISYANNLNSSPASGSTPGSAFGTAGLGRLPLVLPPNVAPYNNDGTYNTLGAGLGAGANLDPGTGNPLNVGYYNPNLILDKNLFTSESNQIQGSIFANVRLTKGLNWRISYGIDRLSSEDISFQTALGGDGFTPGGSATNAYSTRNRWNVQNTLQYDFKLAEKHNFSVLAGAEEQRTVTNRWGINRTTVADNFFVTEQGNYTNVAISNNFQGENYLVSYFGRINYDFNKRFFASVNVRRDGYSAWAQKYGNFYGASVGYTISEEDFWRNSSLLNNVSFLKVKASYGEVGNNQGIADFASYQLYNSGLYATGATLTYTQAGNPLLSWESSKKTDIGFAYGILNDRIQGDFSYYNNEIDNLILDVQQSASKGIPGNSIPSNVGTMRNSGIELSIKYNAINKGNFSWTISANFTTLKNEVVKLNSATDKIFTATSGLEQPSVTMQGQSVGSILAVPSIGINPANGRRMFQKMDGTVAQYDHLGTGWTDVATGLSTTSPSQLVDGVIYGPTLPKYYGGFDNTFRYKNFDLGIFLQFSGGNYVYNGTKAGLRDQRFWNGQTEMLTDRWTDENHAGTIPRVVYGDNVSNGSALVISENVEKGDFIRGRNLSLGYTLNKAVLDKLRLSNARVYVQCQNAFIITGYKGADPENQANGNSTTSAGIDRNSVPQARTYTVGINLGF